jgi:hypothetical protein
MALLPLAKKDGNVHRTLLNFWSATLVDFVERIRGSKKETNEELVKVLTEGFFKALEAAGSDEQMQVRDFQMWKPAAGSNISSCSPLLSLHFSCSSALSRLQRDLSKRCSARST